MARMIPYNFSAAKNVAQAVKLACCKTSSIVTLHQRYTGKTYSNIAVTFPMPAKATASIALVNHVCAKGDPDLWLKFVADVDQFYVDAQRQNMGTGKSVDQYCHDLNAVVAKRPQATQQTVAVNKPTQTDSIIQVEDMDKVLAALDDVDTIEPATRETKAEQETTTPQIDANTGNPLTDAIRGEINMALSTLKIKAGTDVKEVNALIKAALQSYAAPNIVHIRNETTGVTVNAGLQHKLFPELISYMQLGFPLFLPGPAGSGKTTAIRNACKHLNAELFMPPEGPIENKYGLIGYNDAQGQYITTTLYDAVTFAAENPDKLVYFFIDEIDSGYANALMIMNAVMENGYCNFPNGKRIEYGANMRFIAAANTFGTGATHDYVGRNKLDAATLDRFIFLEWGYDIALEKAIAGNDAWVDTVVACRIQAKAKDIKQVISPRASIRGAAMLAAGIPRDKVLKATVYKGMTQAQITSIGVN